MHRHGMLLSLALLATACKPGDILDVPPPADVLSSGALQSQGGAELCIGHVATPPRRFGE